jgi:hypothetical protein
MRGVADRYNVVDRTLNRPLTLDQRIAQCRTEPSTPDRSARKATKR